MTGGCLFFSRPALPPYSRTGMRAEGRWKKGRGVSATALQTMLGIANCFPQLLKTDMTKPCLNHPAASECRDNSTNNDGSPLATVTENLRSTAQQRHHANLKPPEARLKTYGAAENHW